MADIGMVIAVTQMLAGLAAGFYGVRIYRATKGGAQMFESLAVFAVLAAVIGFANLLGTVFVTDTVIGYSIPKAIENVIIPAQAVLAVMIGIGLARFARGE